jgi:hypothetical protein
MGPKTEKTVVRRTPQQIIDDLQARIESVKARQAARAAKRTPEGQALVLAVRALDKAGRVAVEAGNGDVARALDAARAALAPAAVGLGLRVPETKSDRKRKPAA